MHSDVVYSSVRPFAVAVGKLLPKHIRETMQNGESKLEVNPDAYIRFLLQEPNPFMSMQKLQERMGWQLKINGNAFAAVTKDAAGLPTGIYPLPASSVETEVVGEELVLWFTLPDGKRHPFFYSDVIHLRQNFDGQDDFFGTSLATVLAPLMEQVAVIDKGIIAAIKNSNVIRWLLKMMSSVRPEDVKAQAENFAASYLNVESGSVGVAAVDAKVDAIQVEPKSYVPNAPQMDRATQRIYSVIGTNEKIVKNLYTEDEWNAFYEAEIEPAAIDMKYGFTTRLFSRRGRARGNSVIFESTSLTTASMSTKLALMGAVDRGAMRVNEWRKIMNYGPVEGGDKLIRRLDTQVVKEVRTDED